MSDKCVVCSEQKEGKPLYKKLESNKFEVDVFTALKYLALANDLNEEDRNLHYICWECDEIVVDAYEQHLEDEEKKNIIRKQKKKASKSTKAKPKAPKPLDPVKQAELQRKEEQRYYASHCNLCSCSFDSSKGFLRFSLAKLINNDYSVAKMLEDLKLGSPIGVELHSKRYICCNCFNTTRRSYRAFLKDGVLPSQETNNEPKPPLCVNKNSKISMSKPSSHAEHAAELAKIIPASLASTYKILGYNNNNINSKAKRPSPAKIKPAKTPKKLVKPTNSILKLNMNENAKKTKVNKNTSLDNKTVNSNKKSNVNKNNKMRRLSETSSSSSSSSSSSDSSSSDSEDEKNPKHANTSKKKKGKPATKANKRKPSSSSSSSSSSSDNSSSSDSDSSSDNSDSTSDSDLENKSGGNTSANKEKSKSPSLRKIKASTIQNGNETPTVDMNNSDICISGWCCICAREYSEKPISWWYSLNSNVPKIPGVSIQLALQYIDTPLASLPDKVLKEKLLCQMCFKTVSTGFRNQILRKVASTKGIAMNDIDLTKFKVRRLDEDNESKSEDIDDGKSNEPIETKKITDSSKKKKNTNNNNLNKSKTHTSPVKKSSRLRGQNPRSPKKNKKRSCSPGTPESSYQKKFKKYLSQTEQNHYENKLSSESFNNTKPAKAARSKQKRNKDSDDEEYIPHKKIIPLIPPPNFLSSQSQNLTNENVPRDDNFWRHEYGIVKNLKISLNNIRTSLPSISDDIIVSAEAIDTLVDDCCGICSLALFIKGVPDKSFLTESSSILLPNIPISYKWARLSVGISSALSSEKICTKCASNISKKFISFIREKVAESQDMDAKEIDLKGYRITFNEECMNIVADQIDDEENNQSDTENLNNEPEDKSEPSVDPTTKSIKRKLSESHIPDKKMKLIAEKRMKLVGEFSKEFNDVSEEVLKNKISYLRQVWSCISVDTLITMASDPDCDIQLKRKLNITPGLVTLLHHYCHHLNYDENVLTIWVEKTTGKSLKLDEIKQMLIDNSLEKSSSTQETVNSFVSKSLNDNIELESSIKQIESLSAIDIDDSFSWSHYLDNVNVAYLMLEKPHKKLVSSEFTNGVLYGLWRMCKLINSPIGTLRQWLVKLSPLQLSEEVLDKLLNAVEIMHKHIQNLPEHITQLGVPIFSYKNKNPPTSHGKASENKATSAKSRRKNILNVDYHKTANVNPPKTSNVNPPKTSNVNPPKTSNVNPPKTSNVNPPKTSNVNPPENTNVNSPKESSVNSSKVSITKVNSLPVEKSISDIQKPTVKNCNSDVTPILKTNVLNNVNGSKYNSSASKQQIYSKNCQLSTAYNSKVIKKGMPNNLKINSF